MKVEKLHTNLNTITSPTHRTYTHDRLLISLPRSLTPTNTKPFFQQGSVQYMWEERSLLQNTHFLSRLITLAPLTCTHTPLPLSPSVSPVSFCYTQFLSHLPCPVPLFLSPPFLSMLPHLSRSLTSPVSLPLLSPCKAYLYSFPLSPSIGYRCSISSSIFH